MPNFAPFLLQHWSEINPLKISVQYSATYPPQLSCHSKLLVICQFLLGGFPVAHRILRLQNIFAGVTWVTSILTFKSLSFLIKGSKKSTYIYMT